MTPGILTSEACPTQLHSQARAARRAEDAAKAQRNLVAAWGLAAVSLSHHMGHILHLMVGS